MIRVGAGGRGELLINRVGLQHLLLGAAPPVQPPHDAARPVVQSCERAAVERPRFGLQTDTEPRSRSADGPAGHLPAHHHPVHPPGKRGLPEAGGKPAEIRKASVQR